VQLIPNYTCEFRLCPDCARRQANKKFNKYQGRVYAYARTHRVTPMHLVLTQEKRKGESLQGSVDRLMTAYRKLIRRSVWKEYFKGGLWSIEFTFDGTAYHTHLHLMVFRAKFIDVDLLRAEWSAAGGGQNLRLLKIDDVGRGLREVLKYIAKPIDIGNFTATNLKDVLKMKGKRFFGTFGEFRKFSSKFNERDYEEILSELETPEDVSDLREGDLCPDCLAEGVESPLFQLRHTAEGYIEYLRHMEGCGLPDLYEVAHKRKPPSREGQGH